mmetsp:Transcript_270/g.601  ORF Transcript_270/g.601 Transcript_270/m.601 type:complete len:211 (-) Transcript_270:54-686(-)
MSPSETEATFALSLSDTKNTSKISAWHDDASSSVRGHLIELIENVQTLEGWIALALPPMEDGNNFGVSVQLTAAKQLKELRESLTKDVNSAVNYYKTRAEVTEKLTPRLSHTTTSTESNVNASGGKDGDEKKKSDSVTIEQKTCAPEEIGQHLRIKAVLSVDMQYYVEWKASLQGASNAYAAAIDQIEKNLEKITKPRGGNPGGASMSMF